MDLQHLHVHQMAFVGQGLELVCFLVQSSFLLGVSQSQSQLLGQIPQTLRPCQAKAEEGLVMYAFLKIIYSYMYCFQTTLVEISTSKQQNSNQEIASHKSLIASKRKQTRSRMNQQENDHRSNGQNSVFTDETKFSLCLHIKVPTKSTV